ncbi:MAG: SGNH/GDSL hydrolase family protein [Verrucomicrobiota bacterium]
MGSNKQKKRERRERMEAAREAANAPKTKKPSLPLGKKLLYSIVPVCVLLIAAEVVARVAGLAAPTLKTSPLPEETVGMFQTDPELFWTLKPNATVQYGRATVKINSLGLRAPEIEPKAENEYRILSLGESTTFGVGAENHQTYTERVGRLLQEQLPNRKISAINAGVSAWSSFQSLKYLELRGLKLKPDLVLFYHEVNDYLPSTLRNSGNTEIGVMKTDKELYESRMQGVQRRLLESSAFFKWLNNTFAYKKIEKFNQTEFRNPMLEVGLPDLAIPPRLTIGDEDEDNLDEKPKPRPQTDFNEMSLGRRVSEEEREQNFRDLVALCKKEGIELVVIHPSYQASRKHECLLTRFCASHQVKMFEVHDLLHPPGQQPLYIDGFHPSREGHKRIAAGLSAYLLENILKP